MGWGDVISIGLGLGNAALNASNASTLQQMKMQQAGEALYREFIASLRTSLFQLKQTAESVLAGETAEPLKSAGAMRILDRQLTVSGLTPDLFPEFADKDYVVKVIKLIRENSDRMYTQLDKVQQARVDQLVEYVSRLPDYRYYLENLDEGDEMRDASEVASSGGPSRVTILALASGAISIFLIVVAVGMNIASFLLLLIGFVLLISAVIMAVLRRKVSQAQQTVEELEDIVDLERFTALEEEFESPEDVEEKQKQAEIFIESFFGDFTLLDQSWRS